MNTAQEIYDYFNKDYLKAERFIKIKYCAIERIPILRELKNIHYEQNKIHTTV